MGNDVDKGFFMALDLKTDFNKYLPIEKCSMVLVQDVEMGRGWAILTEVALDLVEILKQDHRDTVRDEMLTSKWLKKQSIELKYKKVKNIDKL